MRTTHKLADLNLPKVENLERIKGGATTGTYCGPCGGTVQYAYGSVTGTTPNGKSGTVYYGGAVVTAPSGQTGIVGGAIVQKH
jgi:hypothetical protein